MRSAEAVIVGAGILGAAAAFALVQRGITDVAILEQEDMPNRHSSGRNASACVCRTSTFARDPL